MHGSLIYGFGMCINRGQLMLDSEGLFKRIDKFSFGFGIKVRLVPVI